ncbi:MAG: molybdenum ABC transporter ATP-binding protein [Methylococcus sp.]|nr:molybdenum ABC transporter ATP-binding protein [Methylococcus sp.]
MLSLDVDINRGRFRLEARVEFEEGVSGLFGRSGSGKSTLLNVIAGVIDPDRGRVVLDGETLFDSEKGLCVPSHRRRIGFVFQDSQLFPHYTVKGNLLYGWKQTPPRERRFKLDDVVDLLAIGHLLDSHPRRISGGEKQRVALGRALLASPRMLLLDEPLAALDQSLKEQILPFMRRVRDELGLPMVYVSHSLPEILYLTDQLTLIAGGRILGSGPLHTLLDAEQIRSEDRLGLDNSLAVTIESHDAEGGCTFGIFQGRRLALPFRSALMPGDRVYVSVHRTEVALGKSFVEGLSIQNQLPGRIVSIDSAGDSVQIVADVGVLLRAEITQRAYRDMALREGDAVNCLIKATSFSYLTLDEGDEKAARSLDRSVIEMTSQVH